MKRETGLVALRASEEVSLTVENAQELQRVDAEEFHRAAPDKKDGILSAFRFLKTDFGLSVRAETVQPQIEAVVRNSVRIGAESVQVAAQIDYTIKRAGVFALRLALPAGYRLESVTGDKVSQWVERTENGAALVEVTLKERTIGAYTLNLVLVQNYRQPPKTLAIAGVHPLDTQKLSGYITVATDLGVAAKTGSFDGLTEIPFASVPGERAVSGGSALAYKFIATTPGGGAGLAAERHDGGRRAVAARRDHEHDHPDRDAGQRPDAGEIRHRQRAGEGVPACACRRRSRMSRSPARRSAAGTRPTANGASSCKARCAGNTC